MVSAFNSACTTRAYRVTIPETTLDNTEPEVQPTVSSTPSWLDQDELLKDLWTSNVPPEKIAEQLGRSVAAIMTRAARLGLPRRAAPGRKPGYQRKQTAVKARKMKSEALFTDEKSADFVEEEKPLENVKMMRICLMCLTRFPSEGRHNRICPSCKGTADYMAGSSVPDVFKMEG